MKIRRSQLKEIVKEELEVTLFLRELRSMNFLFEAEDPFPFAKKPVRPPPSRYPSSGWRPEDKGALTTRAQDVEKQPAHQALSAGATEALDDARKMVPELKGEQGIIWRALTKMAEAVGFVDPCAYINEKNREDEYVKQLGDLEEALERLKKLELEAGDRKLKDLSKSLAVIAGFELVIGLGVEGWTQIGRIIESIPFVSGWGNEAGALMTSGTWFALGKWTALLSVLIFIWRWLVKAGQACSVKNTVVNLGKALSIGLRFAFDAAKAGVSQLFKWTKGKIQKALRRDTTTQEIKEIMYEFKQLGIFPNLQKELLI